MLSKICSGAGESCDAEVSVWGRAGKATVNGELVGSFYNYGCAHSANGGSEANAGDGDAQNTGYWSFCCCRKEARSHRRGPAGSAPKTGNPSAPPVRAASTARHHLSHSRASPVRRAS